MDRNRNEDIDHGGDDLVGMGDERPRATEKKDNARNNKVIRRGSDTFAASRSGEPSGGSGD